MADDFLADIQVDTFTPSTKAITAPPLEIAEPIIVVPFEIDSSRSPYRMNRINYMAELPEANSDDSSNDEPVVVVPRKLNRRQENLKAYRDKRAREVAQYAQNRVPVVPVAVPPRPVIQPVVQPAFDPTEITEDMFWKTIEAFRWANASDETINLTARRDAANLLHVGRKEAIKQFYKRKSDNLLAYIQNVLDKKNVFAPDSINIVLSHIIALGNNWYDMVIDDPDMAEFLIDANECQNFYYCISNLL